MFSMKINTKKDKPTSQNSKPKQTITQNGLSNVFGNVQQNESSETLSKRQLLNREAKRKKTQRELDQMLKNNPSVFQYDEVYDSIQDKRDETFREKQIEKTLRPVRYMDNIQKIAKKRQTRHDAARERLLLTERKETDHLFENKEKYITRAYKDKLKEIEEQRTEDKVQSHIEKTVDDDQEMFGFFNNYLQNKTNTLDRNRKRKKRSISRSKSRSRSRSRERNTNNNKTEDKALNEEQKYLIEQHQKELNKKTFNENKQKELDKTALKKCSKHTTKLELQSLRERYLKRKSLKQSSK